MKHYKKVIIEGNELERLLNMCLIKGINIGKVKAVSETEMIILIRSSDYVLLHDIAGGRYKISIISEEGYIYRIGIFLKKRVLILGLLFFVMILFYQSLFIAEIEVMGYESISEQDLRESMREAGFCEGCRKNISISKVKLHLYDDFDNISWIGIKYKGNLAQVTIAETKYLYEKNKVEDTTPCNIVAEKSGYISSVDPKQGLRMVEDGQHVKEGDVIISGIVPLEKTTYEEESEKQTESYVHASGTAIARVPVRVNLYNMAYETVKKPTGKKMMTLTINDYEIMRSFCPYELAVVNTIDLINCAKPVKLKIQINMIEEVTIEQEKITDKAIKQKVLDSIHEFTEENLPDNTQILNKSLNFTREKNIIRIGVTLETLQQIGKEEEIIVDKSNRQSDQDDDQ